MSAMLCSAASLCHVQTVDLLCNQFSCSDKRLLHTMTHSQHHPVLLHCCAHLQTVDLLCNQLSCSDKQLLYTMSNS
jgi:hypothetical protein